MKTNRKTPNRKTSKSANSQTGSGFTVVRTGYARAAMLLLAVNLCLTAYAFTRLNDYVDQRLEASETGGNPELLEVTQQD